MHKILLSMSKDLLIIFFVWIAQFWAFYDTCKIYPYSPLMLEISCMNKVRLINNTYIHNHKNDEPNSHKCFCLFCTFSLEDVKKSENCN